MSGGFDYAKAYKDYGAGKYSDADFERYVDSNLSGAWDLVNTYRQGGDMSKFPMHGHMTPEQQAEYWINRGATSKAAFGRSHAAEDAALYGGTYSGGRSGRTDIMPGTQAYEDYFGDSPGTRFEGAMGQWQDNPAAAAGNGAAAAAATAPITGGGVPGSSLYPMGLVDYEAPTAMPGIPLEYQPWLQPDHIPDSLWNYQPPTLQEWSLDPRMGWADTPVSEFAPKEESPPTARNEENDGNQGDPLDHAKDISPGVYMDQDGNIRTSDPYGDYTYSEETWEDPDIQALSIADAEEAFDKW